MSENIQTTEQFIPAPGGKILTKTWTPHSLQNPLPILLFHDSLGCIEMWRDFPARLCSKTGRKVVAYDRLGFGRSDARTTLPSVRFVNEEAEVYLPAVLKDLAINEFTIFGHSVGGGMAVTSAGQFPKQCKAIITESAQAFVEDRTREGISKAAVDFAGPETFARLQKYHGEKTQWVLDAWIKVWLSQDFATWSLQADLPKVHCPVLAIHGDKDEYGSVRFPEMIAALTAGFSQKEVLKDCGHVPHREKTGLILNLVQDFLRQHS